MEKGRKELKVAALRNGTVIDHIPSEKLFKVISILGLESCATQVTFGYNLDSKRIGKKAIVKVADKYLSQEEVNKIAFLAPKAKINIGSKIIFVIAPITTHIMLYLEKP